jgi:hypothetical protein
MLMEKAVTDSGTAPVTVSVTYDKGALEVQIPVFFISPKRVFAPPFLIPRGNWTVVYEVKTPGWVFESVTYPPSTSLPTGVKPPDNSNAPGGRTWRTKFDTCGVTDVNKLDCTIGLMQTDFESFGSDERLHHELHHRRHHTGDPTIAVVKDPMDG